MKNKIIIGARGSKLALIYAERAKNELLEKTNIKDIEIRSIKTLGDKITNVRLSEYGGKGLFCKTIEQELINQKIDIAVHALKDMPIEETEGLLTSCFLERNDPREILISRNNKSIKDLKLNSIIGTSSYRREFQLKNMRNDLKCKLIRGNVDTRIKKLKDGLFDAIILSYAGINSLGFNNRISQIFSTSEIIPSAGQGAIALQCRVEDQKIIEMLDKINHKSTQSRINAERGVLKVLEGDCETAVGAHAIIREDSIELEAELFSLDGKERYYFKASKDIKSAVELGKEVGILLKKESKDLYKK